MGINLWRCNAEPSEDVFRNDKFCLVQAPVVGREQLDHMMLPSSKNNATAICRISTVAEAFQVFTRKPVSLADNPHHLEPHIATGSQQIVIGSGDDRWQKGVR